MSQETNLKPSETEQYGPSTDQGPNMSKPSSSVDIQFIIARVKDVILNPKNVWDTVKNEQTSISDLYKSYVMVLAAIPVVCGFIGMSFIGMAGFTTPVGHGLMQAVVGYAVSLLVIYIAAMIVQKLAPVFDGQVSMQDSFKLMAYSYTPAYVAGIFSLIPALGILGGLLSLYGLYVFYQGIAKMTSVPGSKQLGYCIASVVCIIVVSVILTGILLVGLVGTAVTSGAVAGM